MENQVKEKFTKILLDGKTLKCDIADALEVISGNEKLAAFDSQNGNIANSLTAASKISNGKVVVKHFFINDRTKEILYWCFCNINDILSVSGIANFDGNRYKINRINREDQISFLGKDIKAAIDHCNNKNKYIAAMNDNYVNIDHPIADNVFYNIRFNAKEDKINCMRNTDLSPRPVKNI